MKKINVFQVRENVSINVKVNSPVCKKAGMRITNDKCMELQQCSWFRHSMDSYYNNPGLSNLPAGFTEPY